MADPAVWITGTGPDKQLNFRLPTGGKGDKGDKGDPGQNGSNVLPTDTAIKDAIANPASATRGELNATYPSRREAIAQSFLGLRTALDMGESCGIGWQGDSTGDADFGGSGDRFALKFLQNVTAKYPAAHVLYKQWSDTSQDFGAWSTIQSQAAGRRYAELTGSVLEYYPPVPADTTFTTGNLDLRVLHLPAAGWVAGTNDRALIVRMALDAGGLDRQFQFVLKSDGKLNLAWSDNGTSFGSNALSTAAVPGVNGTPLWLRVTATITAGTGWYVNFYTSPATDGVTWTQVGTQVSFTGAIQGMWATTAPIFQVGGIQRISSPANGKFYEVQIRDGINGPLIAPAAIERWKAYPVGTHSYGGAQTVYMLNGSKSGADMAYLAGTGGSLVTPTADPKRLAKMTPDYGQMIHVLNDSHNEVVTGKKKWLDPYKAWADAVLARLPLASIIATAQNPHTSAYVNEATSGYHHKTRTRELAALAAREGWGLLNIYQDFLEDPAGVTALISSDGLHPSPAGYTLGGKTATRMLGFSA